MRAQTRLSQTVNDGLREEFGKRTVHDVVSGERDKIMDLLREKADADARKIGVQVLDVRLKRVDLPQEVSESVYRRMEAERKRVANELRSTGSGGGGKDPRRCRPAARSDLAEAYRDAQSIKGEGDAKASAIYADRPSGRTPSSMPSIAASKPIAQSFKNKSDVMVLEPSSEFFKYLKSPGGSDDGCGSSTRRGGEP